MNTKLYNYNEISSEQAIRILPCLDDLSREVHHAASIFSNFGRIEIDNRKLPVGNRVKLALEDNIDLIMLIDDKELLVYSIIFKGQRYCLKPEDILKLVAGG